MSHIRFNHVFLTLLALSFLCAFVIPMRLTNPVRAQFQNIFAPVARPVGAIAHFVHGKFSRPDNLDPRDAAIIQQENERLKTSLSNLQVQLKTLLDLMAERQLIGDVLPLCTPVPVVGSDSGMRESLAVQSMSGIHEGMFALYWGGIVGRLDRAGMTGAAQVRLITDPGFSVQGAFVRLVADGSDNARFQTITSPPPLVEGAGKGSMVIRRLPMEEVKDVRPNDWVIVNDRDWPQQLQGYKLGIVESVEPSPSAPLFAEIKLRPMKNLMQLREVLVMNKLAPDRSAKTE